MSVPFSTISKISKAILFYSIVYLIFITFFILLLATPLIITNTPSVVGDQNSIDVIYRVFEYGKQTVNIFAIDDLNIINYSFAPSGKIILDNKITELLTGANRMTPTFEKNPKNKRYCHLELNSGTLKKKHFLQRFTVDMQVRIKAT